MIHANTKSLSACQYANPRLGPQHSIQAFHHTIRLLWQKRPVFSRNATQGSFTMTTQRGRMCDHSKWINRTLFWHNTQKFIHINYGTFVAFARRWSSRFFLNCIEPYMIQNKSKLSRKLKLLVVTRWKVTRELQLTNAKSKSATLLLESMTSAKLIYM